MDYGIDLVEVGQLADDSMFAATSLSSVDVRHFVEGNAN